MATRTCPDRRVGADAGATRSTPRRWRRCAPRSGAATSTRSISCSTSRRRSPAIRRAGERCLRRFAPRTMRRRRLGDRLRLAGALPRPARPAGLDVPDQGHAAARRARGGREGLGRARDDRRPRAERPLPRLRAGLGALAGADGRARAGGRHASRLDGRGNAREAASAWPSCSQRPSPAAPSRARRRSPPLDLIAALEPVGRGASMGALGTRARQRRPRARAHDPHVRGRRRADPPLGRRRHRLGLRARGRDRRVVDEGAAAARRASAHRSRRGHGDAARRCGRRAAASSIRTSRCCVRTTRRSCGAGRRSRRSASTRERRSSSPSTSSGSRRRPTASGCRR